MIAGQPVVIQVAISESTMRRFRRDLLFILLFGLPVGIAMAGLGGYTLARRALAPVNHMAERARYITAERLSDRLPVDHPDDELGRLATVFNDTLGRLESSFDQMRRFTSDISHELRTPLTAMRSVGEIGLRTGRSASVYRGVIGSMLEEVDRLSCLVDRLLALSRAEAGQAKLSAEETDLAELAGDVVAHLGVLAEEKRQALTFEDIGGSVTMVDRVVLRQALINVIDNAIKYTPAGGSVEVRVGGSTSTAWVEVRDSGPGVGADGHARIFDRYYRDQQHGATVRGSGLGLAIAKWAVDVNGGKLTLEQSTSAGSTFRITLPAVAAPRLRRTAIA
jgi:signal transduction histidine kinase